MIKISDSSKLNKAINKTKIQKDNKWYAKKYASYGFIPFTLQIGVKNDGKKDLRPPKGYNDIDCDNYQDFVNNEANGMAIRTGCEIDNDYHLILVDIDNKETDKVKNGVDKWKLLISDKEEINTPTQKTGNNGLHYLFKIHKDIFEKLPSSGTELEIDGQKYAIDFKAKNQFMLVEPSEYDEKCYKWLMDMSTNVQEMPKWLIKIITKINSNKKIKVIRSQNENNVSENNCSRIILKNVPKINVSDEIIHLMTNDNELSESDKQINYSDDDVEYLLNLLSVNRCDNYEEWLKVGMCLYNINKAYIIFWKKWSQCSDKYKKGLCEEKWKTFSRNKELTIGSLLYWCKMDNKEAYKLFIKGIKTNNIISNKFPDANLKLGETKIISKNHSYINLNNDNCLIKGDNHGSPTMYVEMIKDLMYIRCKHSECFGKIYPCEHVQLTKNEMNVIFNGDINVSINNIIDGTTDIDDMKKINLFETDYINNLVYKGLNGKPIPFAHIMYEFTKQIYEYDSVNDQWYIYENHKWNLIKSYNAILRDLINTQLKDLYTKVKIYYCEQEGKYSKSVKTVSQLITNFDGTQLTDDIMKELKYTFLKMNKDKYFLEKLNSNQFLIGFENGVYDLKNNVFRNGVKEDYISMSTRYNYTNKHSKHNNKLLKFLEDIQPNKDERDYLLTYVSTALFGNTLELFTVLIGDGRNGKSKFIQLLEKVFGDYYDTIKSQLLTSQMKDGDSPSPALLSLANRRIVVASETLEGTKLNTGFIKFITGRDTVKHRLCHQNDMIKFSPNFVTLLVCNDIPECDNMDNAFSKRLRCINFPTEFVDGEPIKENQKKKNDNINIYFDDWKQDFFLLLTNYYKCHEENKALMIPTENILKWTNQYKEYTDTYLSFLNECTENSTSHVKSAQLYENFKQWFRCNNPNCKIPSSKVFTTGIRKYKSIERIKFNGVVTTGIKLMKLKKG